MSLSSSPPPLLLHCDWSVSPAKRWLVCARLVDGRYRVEAPQPAGAKAASLLDPCRFGGTTADTLLLGIDAPIGLPLAYARQIGCENFVEWLPRLGHGRWADFYRPAETAAEIGLTRPFYPARPGGTRQAHLTQALNVETINDLRRVCDRPTAERRAAAPLFWTMGAQQVGKGAIALWRDLLAPQTGRYRLWPFEGSLGALLHDHQMVICEAYPAEFYTHLGVIFPRRPGQPSGKRVQAERQAQAAGLQAWANAHHVELTADLKQQLADGFGRDASGEDRFDALVGVLGMLNVVLGHRPPGTPAEPIIREVEGWILGMAP